MVDENNKDKITKIITKALAPLAALKHLSRVDWHNVAVSDAKIPTSSASAPISIAIAVSIAIAIVFTVSPL